MRVLVVSPHCDDEILGCGGYMAKLVKAGHDVYTLVLCDRSETHDFDPHLIRYLQSCCVKANKETIGVKEVFFAHLQEERLDRSLSEVIVPIEKYIAAIRPSLVMVPHGGDVNQDHRAVFQASLVATRTLGNWEEKYDEEEIPPILNPNPYVQKEKISTRYNVGKVLVYEVLSTTEQAPPDQHWAFSPNVFVDITDEIETKVQALACYESEIDEFPFPRSKEGIKHLAAYRGMACACKAAEAYMLKREIVFSAVSNGRENRNDSPS